MRWYCCTSHGLSFGYMRSIGFIGISFTKRLFCWRHSLQLSMTSLQLGLTAKKDDGAKAKSPTSPTKSFISNLGHGLTQMREAMSPKIGRKNRKSTGESPGLCTVKEGYPPSPNGLCPFSVRQYQILIRAVTSPRAGGNTKIFDLQKGLFALCPPPRGARAHF